MDTSLEHAVRDRARDYLDGKVTFDDFLSWFIPVVVRMRSSDDAALRQLVSAIELLWIDFTEDEVTGAEFREKLRTLVSEMPLDVTVVTVAPQVPVEGDVSRFTTSASSDTPPWTREVAPPLPYRRLPPEQRVLIARAHAHEMPLGATARPRPTASAETPPAHVQLAGASA
jgi:hypothetical protein